MLNFSTQLNPLKQTFFNSCKVPLVGLLLTLGLSGGGLNPLAAYSSEGQAAANNTETVSSAETDAQLPNGVYLYGQSSDPNEIGKEYFVVEIRDGKTVGAFYMPHSSFDCFYGRIEGQQLALTIVNSYDQTAHPFKIALQANSNVATSSDPAVPKVKLLGYQQLAAASENDRNMLQTCKADFADRIWGE